MSHPTWTEKRARMRPRPYLIEPLVVAIGLDPGDPRLTSRLVAVLGIDRGWVRRCRQVGGLTAQGADRWASRAGLHPGIVWPQWWDDPADVDALPGEDDPALEELAPIPAQRLAELRRQGHRLRVAS